jgi:hypothetical protein
MILDSHPDERGEEKDLRLIRRHTLLFLRFVMHGIAANAANRAALPQHKN